MSLLEKTQQYDKDTEKSFTSKINKHTLCCYLLFAHSSFDNNKNKLDFYRGENFLKKFV